MEFELKNGYFKIYFATPSIFEKGWLPEWIDENSYCGNYNGIDLKLVACAVGKPEQIGGWNIAKGKPKPSYKLVPAGSVYYFKINGKSSPSEIKKSFHMQNISDKNSKDGFGLCLLGEV
jgi:CRISPR-associated protein Cmr3